MNFKLFTDALNARLEHEECVNRSRFFLSPTLYMLNSMRLKLQRNQTNAKRADRLRDAVAAGRCYGIELRLLAAITYLEERRTRVAPTI